MNLHYLRRLISIAILLILMIRKKFNDSFTYYVKPIWLAENDISPNVSSCKNKHTKFIGMLV